MRALLSLVPAAVLSGCNASGIPREVKIFWMAALLILGGVGGVVALARFSMNRKARQRFRDLVNLVDSGRGGEALPAIRQGKKWEFTPEGREQWDALEMAVYVQQNDIGGLMHLFEASPKPFTTDETAALLTGRAQLETGRLDAFSELRRVWVSREGKIDQWLGLEADLLVLREQPEEATALLRRFKFEGPAEGRRLCRLAYLLVDQEPALSQRAIDLAAQQGPKVADVWLYTGRYHEHGGRHQAAYAAYTRALECAPGDRFVQNHLAEFLVRQGAYTQALQAWADAVAWPSLDFLWLKFLFWQRVANAEAGGDLHGACPDGPLKPLVEALRRLHDDAFWNEDKLARHLHGRQDIPEVSWLRTLEALRTGEADSALSLLNLGVRTTHPVVENALKQVLTYRRTGFFEPGIACLDANTPAAFRHALFVRLDQWINGATMEDPPDLVEMITAGTIYAAILRASGWNAAAERLEAAL